MTKLLFTRSWRAYRKGQTVDIPGGLAAELIGKRIAVEDHQGALIETAAIEPATETADATPKRRGRRAVSKSDSPDQSGR